jgi:hypothetical protein
MPQKSSVIRNISWFLLKLVFLLSFVALAIGQTPHDLDITLDPTATTIHWTLGDVIHTVHGTFRLKKGSVHYDPLTGNATGPIEIDVTSGESAAPHAI